MWWPRTQGVTDTVAVGIFKGVSCTFWGWLQKNLFRLLPLLANSEAPIYRRGGCEGKKEKPGGS